MGICSASAQNNETVFRKYSNDFLNIGVGGRALAMGNSVVATTRDVTSAYWNPSSLVYLPSDLQLGAMHASYFANIGKFDYLGGATRLSDSSALAFTMVRFGVDDIPNTLELIDNEGNIRYDRIKSFSVADYAFLVSYARSMGIPGLKIGGNAKLIRRVAGDFASAWGFGFDLSALYDAGNWQIGAVARDITTTFNAWKFNTSELEDAFALTGNELPDNSVEMTMPRLLLGGAYKFDISENFGGLVELDADVTFDGKRNVVVKSDPVSIDPHFGLEANFRQLVFVRAGVGNMQTIPGLDSENEFTFQPNLGIGLKFWRLGIDYAFTDIGDQSVALYSHIFSLSFNINKQGL
ncbi:MAG: hypothetical protein C0594_12700 [Marinilabiliales bacterium]|nr:MAG: hypothetical protein C0594_12700 [Marinilabiliales bacterium]